MTTYRAIGKYAIDATDDEKRRALEDTIYEAAVELVTMGAAQEWLEGIFEEAYARAEIEREEIERASPAAPSKEGEPK